MDLTTKLHQARRADLLEPFSIHVQSELLSLLDLTNKLHPARRADHLEPFRLHVKSKLLRLIFSAAVRVDFRENDIIFRILGL